MRHLTSLVVAFSFCVLAPTQQPASSSTLAAKVDAAVAPHLKSPRAVGLSVGVLVGGELLGKGYGLADAELDVAANADTMFRIGSITKQFTAALVLRLVEQGKVELEGASTKYVPEFATGERTVTVHQLLNHTSGIVSYTDVGESWQKLWPLELSHLELLDLVRQAPFDFEPGQGWRYNNTGYYLLGMLLENVRGASYAAQIDELAAELGLSRTRYDSNADLIKNRARGYSGAGAELRNAPLLGMSQPGAAGGMLSTGKDLVRWAKALTDGKVVGAASYAKMSAPCVLPSGEDTHYGYGLVTNEFAGLPCVGHGGGIHGFNSALFWLPGRDFHVAVVSNGALSAQQVAEDIAYAVLGLARPRAEDLPIDAELCRELAGDYHIETLDLGIKVFAKAGKLYSQGDGQGAFRLLFQGGREFRADFDAAVRLVFAANGKSFELHQGGGVFRAARR